MGRGTYGDSREINIPFKNNYYYIVTDQNWLNVGVGIQPIDLAAVNSHHPYTTRVIPANYERLHDRKADSASAQLVKLTVNCPSHFPNYPLSPTPI